MGETSVLAERHPKRLTRQVLEQEEGQPLVEDLLFNNLIVQP